MTEFTIRNYLDVKALVGDNEEEYEDDDNELADFLNDQGSNEEKKSEWATRHMSPNTVDFSQDALRQAHMACGQLPMSGYHYDEAPHGDLGLGPQEGDPELWLVHMKPGFEMSLVGQISRRTITASQSGRCIASVFAHLGIPGAIFLEGNLVEV